jgi:hypothetical protein
MKNLCLFIALITTLFSSSILANVDKQDISKYEVLKTHKNLNKIVSKFEVVENLKNTLQIYVPVFRTNEFLALAPDSKLISKSIYINADSEILDEYKRYPEVISLMNDLQIKYPKLVSVHSYGKSVKGYDLYYMKISDNVEIDEEEPELLITAATHGDEVITTESLMRFLVNMMNSKDSDPRVTRIIKDHELFFIPVVNPDGFTKRRRYTADGTDPNREYPYPDKPNKSSVQCIKKEIEFFHTRNFSGSMDLHASGEKIMYPWGYTKDEVPSADKVMFETLGQAMSSKNKYRVGQISKIIYVAPASSADYFYWKNATIAFGIELARSKAPRSRKINEVVKDVTSMIYTFIEKF